MTSINVWIENQSQSVICDRSVGATLTPNKHLKVNPHVKTTSIYLSQTESEGLIWETGGCRVLAFTVTLSLSF